MIKAASDFLASVKKYRNIMIIIQGSPDPDAIASSYALKILLGRISINSEIFITKKISLSQNRAFVRLLKIPLKYTNILQHGKFDSYIITDFQNIEVKGISEHIPCAAHIDHHQRTNEKIHADFSLIRTDAGSTSSIISLLLSHIDINFTEEESRNISTALVFGIHTDTDSYEHAGSLDIEALKILSLFADNNIISKINGIPMSEHTIGCYNRALENSHVYKDWGIYSIGFLDIEHRDSIAIVADLLLKKTKFKVVAVYAIIHDKNRHELFLDTSLRTGSPNLDLNSLIKKITYSGGGREYKGAFQVRLDYFRTMPDRDMLLKTVEAATTDWFKRSRDSEYLYEITGVTRNIFRHVTSMLKNK